jgi:hypothetical protein
MKTEIQIIPKKNISETKSGFTHFFDYRLVYDIVLQHIYHHYYQKTFDISVTNK